MENTVVEKRKYFSHRLEDAGFPKLLRDAMKYLQVSGTPEYYGQEYIEAGDTRWMARLRIKDNRLLEDWYTSAFGLTFHDACRVAARDAIRKFAPPSAILSKGHH